MIKNLISVKDITALKKKDNLTGDELQLLQQEGFKEQQLQINEAWPCSILFPAK